MSLKLINKVSGNVINIPKDGTVTLGRGSEVECLDKRLSRKHISISYKSDHAILFVLNNNPCFTMKTGSMIHINKKNDKVELMDGDVISLLPDFKSCAFEVSYSSGLEEVSPSSPSLVQEYTYQESIKDCDITHENCDISNLPLNPLLNNESLISTTCTNNRFEHETNRPEPAVTPDLMNKSDPSFATPSKTNNIDEIEVTNRPSAPVTPDLVQAASPPPGIRLASNLFYTPSVNDVTNSITSELLTTPIVAPIVTSDILDNMEIKTEKIDSSYFSNPGSPSLMNNVDDTMEATPSLMNSMDDTMEATPAKRRAIGEDIASSSSSGTAPTVMDSNFMVKLEPDVQINTDSQNSSRRRPLCRYGQSCYRKNQQHKTEFCHPGDDDWISEDQKPLCPYDPNCYRKCPDHRINMRHTCERQPNSRVVTLPNINAIGSSFNYSSSDYDDDDDAYDEE